MVTSGLTVAPIGLRLFAEWESMSIRLKLMFTTSLTTLKTSGIMNYDRVRGKVNNFIWDSLPVTEEEVLGVEYLLDIIPEIPI